MSDNPSIVSVPPHVTVRKGDTATTFAITTFAVTATQSVRVSGSYGGLTQHDTLTVIPASAIQLTNLTIAPTSVGGGGTATGTVTMSAPAPTGGLVVSLASRHRNVATVPASVTVPGGATTASFTITAQPVKSTHTVDITATYASVTKTATLTVTKSVAGLNIFNRIASAFRHVPLSFSVSTRIAEPLASSLPSRYSLYTPELNLMTETETTTSSSPAITYEYVWFGGQPVAQFDVATNTTHWTFTDHLGTPIIQTDASGAVDWRAEYEPYSTVDLLRAGATRHQPLRFPGQEEDLSTDRSYNIFRWYRSGWGRYTQGDPYGVAASDANLYIYAGSNPELFIDPTGQVTVNQSYTRRGDSGFGGGGSYNLAFAKITATGKCVGCGTHWHIALTLNFDHGYYCTGSYECRIELWHATIASAFVARMAGRWHVYETKEYEDKSTCEALAFFYANDMQQNLLNPNEYPKKLQRDYWLAQSDYEATHHGVCGFLGGLCGAY